MSNTSLEANSNLGMAISPQHAEINETDYDFSFQVQGIVNNTKLSAEEKVTKIINLDNRKMDSYLSYIGLNINSFKKVVRTFYLDGEFDKALELIDSLSQISSLDFSNPIVLDKYIATLDLIGMKSFRFGLNWSKLYFYDEPSESYLLSSKGINDYVEIIKRLIQKGIDPVVTFSHFDSLGMDIITPEFEVFYKYMLEFVLPAIINAGAMKIIPFNEPSVHAGMDNYGFAGYQEIKIKMGPVESALDLVRESQGYLVNLEALLRLNNIFYETAHKINPNVEIILNMNVTQILFGSNDGILRNRVVKPIGKRIEDIHLDNFLGKDESGQPKAKFDRVSIHPYHIVDGAAFTTVTGLIKLCKDLVLEQKFPDPKRVTQLSGRFQDTRIGDAQMTKRGRNGQILSPEINVELIIQICKKYGISEIIITETGLDAGDENLELKKWYYEMVIKNLPLLEKAGIKVFDKFIWSMFRNYEIPNHRGGGMESFNFGALGSPLTVSEFKAQLDLFLRDGYYAFADIITKKVFMNGNVPIQFYPEMVQYFYNLTDSDENYANKLSDLITKYLNFGESEEDLLTSIIQGMMIFHLLDKGNVSDRILDLITRFFTEQLKRIEQLGLTYIDIDELVTIFSNLRVESHSSAEANIKYLESIRATGPREGMEIVLEYLLNHSVRSSSLEPDIVSSIVEGNYTTTALDSLLKAVLKDEDITNTSVQDIIDIMLKLTLLMEFFSDAPEKLIILRGYFLKYKQSLSIAPANAIEALEGYLDNILMQTKSPLKTDTIETKPVEG